ncbi:alpha-xenorhabdolysin family binary toxin subunit A [Pseudomonas sp. PB3P13]
MGIKLDEKIIEVAANAPRVFVAASIGVGDEFNREPGIQLTKEQIISLRQYETLGLSLPIRHDDIANYLHYGTDDTGSTGLTVADFLRTFQIIHEHARRWSPLREQIMLTGTDLKIFAGTILGVGSNIIEVYEDLRATRYLEQHDITTPDEYQKLKLKMPNLPGLELNPEDVPDIKYYLGKLLGRVRSCHAKAKSVQAALDSFSTDMRVRVVPETRLRLGFVSANTYEGEIKDLQKVIDARAAEIDELNKRYDQWVLEAVKSAATLNVGGLVLGIYQGVKAEEVRKERKELHIKQNASNTIMASKNQTLSSLNRVRGDLQNLNYIALEAKVATENLMLVWSALGKYVEASMTEVDEFGDATSLRRFANQIKSVVEPWSVIQTSADQLLEVFAAADAEYDRTNKVLRSGKKMLSGFSAPRYTPYDVVDLRSLNAVVQAASTDSQMLSEQFEYLPGVVATMKSLSVAIGGSVLAVRTHAQLGSIRLKRAAQKLKNYQLDLRNPEDAYDVREDMENELQKVFKALTTHTEDLEGIKTGMSGRFDRSASARWVCALEQDRTTAEQLKALTEEKIVALQPQMQSVSEAIDLIGKAGIDKIGKEAQLTFDNLKALGMAPPQAQIAMLAINTVKKTISGVGDLISYLNMLDGYDRLKEKASELKGQVARHARNITQLSGKIEMVGALDRMDDARWSYVKAFETIVNAFAQFSGDFQQHTSVPVEERVVVALARIPVIVDYLQPIQR